MQVLFLLADVKRCPGKPGAAPLVASHQVSQIGNPMLRTKMTHVKGRHTRECLIRASL
jgi:hypothetical protein